MAWVVTAWKPAVLAAAEREGVKLPDPGRRFTRPAPEPAPAPGEITARKGRATMRDSPLGELFRSTG
jgi:hypothetical protein